MLSCKAQQNQELFYGTFNAVEKSSKGLPSYVYTLQLNRDNAFLFSIRVDLGGSNCSGDWKIAKNKILLECGEVTDPVKALTRGGMDGVQEFRIINKNKLKYKDVILKRTK